MPRPINPRLPAGALGLIPGHVVSDLCGLGRLGEVGSAEARAISKRLARWSVVNRQLPETWQRVADGLATADLTNLVRGLLLADESLPGWSSGSTSGVIWTHSALKWRDLGAACEVTEWGFDKTTNTYVKWSACGIASARRYAGEKRRIAEEHERRQQVEQQAKHRRIEQAKGHVATTSTNAKQRADFLNALSDLPLFERLQTVLSNRDRALSWFPDTWAADAIVQVATFAPRLQDELIERLTGYRNRPWRQLREALVAASESR